VDRTGDLITVHLAPDQIVAAAEVDFDDTMRASDVERIVDAMEKKIRKEHPEVVAIFIKPKAVPQEQPAGQTG
jgi:divalent metal cation (Fe/Co/Zn/Cd) transporter